MPIFYESISRTASFRIRNRRHWLGSVVLFLIVCFWFIAGTAYALDPGKRITQYLHKSWRTQDASLPAGMFSIAQTSDGFLWLLSLSGDVYRFDGVRFVQWPVPTDPSGKVFADSHGGLWVNSKELVRLKGGVVASHFDLEGIHGFQSVSEGPDGSLWIGRRVQEAPLCNVSERGVRCFGKNDGIQTGELNAIIADGNGGLWLGGSTALVHWRAGHALESYSVKAAISTLARTPRGTLSVGLLQDGPGMGLQQLNDGVLKTFVTPSFDGSKVSVTSSMVDRDGNLWVGTDAGGVVRIHDDTVERYRQTDGLSGDSVWALFEDREGVVWAGSTTGIDSFRDPPVTTFSAAQGLGKDLAAGILATRDNTLWVANSGSLDRIRDGKVISIGKSDGLPGNQVAAMLEDRAGNMWVGVDDGLYLFRDGRFHRLPEPDHQPLGMVVGLTEDVDGNIWAACGRPRKLVRIRDFQVREVLAGAQVPMEPHHLAPDPHGGIWMAASTGDLVLLRNGKIETTVPLDRRNSSLNRHVLAGPDGSVLVSSEHGLLGWREGTIRRLTTKNGLPCDFVIAFIQDAKHYWWLYTRCGVVSFSDAELQKWWANPDAIIQTRVYDAFDGAQPNIGSFNAAASTSDGRVWFSSGVVVQMLDPTRMSPSPPAAPATIESLIVDRKEIVARDGVEVGPQVRELQIDYTSPTFSIPQKVQFRYKLDGYDDDWHDAGTRRQAFYTDLPPGHYSFQAVASNSDGIWNDTPATMAFSIAPAYYQTMWFRGLLVVSFVAVLWAGYQYRVTQLHRDLRKLQDVIETIPAMAWTALPDGTNEFINRRWAEFTGLSASDTAGSGWTVAVHPEDLQSYNQKWRTSFTDGKPFEAEARFRSAATGEYRWLLARAVPLRDSHGSIRRWYGILTDIEDRKRTEEALRTSEDQLKIEVEERSSLLDLTLDSISVLDMEFVIKYWNQGAEEFYGWTRQQAMGRRSDELLLTVFPKAIEEIRADLLLNDAWEGELQRTKADGAEVTVASRWSLRRDPEHRPMAILETSNDITERKHRENEIHTLNRELATRSQALEASNKELEAFAYSVSHDLRAPLRHMAGYTQLLSKNATLNSKSEHYLAMILDAAKRMSLLIDDLLAFSRVSRAEVNISAVNLEELVHEVTAEAQHEAEERKIVWNIHSLPRCRGDRSMLRMVLTNLVSNALKFTRPRPQTEIEIGCVDSKDDRIVIFVRDNGVGFDMKYYNKLFGVFRRLHNEEDFEGTGIGLATVQRIVQRHGGQVWAEGKVDGGATFFFSLSRSNADG